jgi:hypothetical protein
MMKRFICVIGLSKVALWPPDPVFTHFPEGLTKKVCVSLRSECFHRAVACIEYHRSKG